MKVWTYKEMKDKVIRDLDLQDELFVSPDEMAGYFNEALSEAESEIMTLNQDYFRTKYLLPVVAGTSRYLLPPNIYGNKIRGILYKNGSSIYEVKQIRRRGLLTTVAFSDQFGASDDYRYILMNDRPGQAELELHPASRDTAIIGLDSLVPSTPTFAPLELWYIRNVQRVPMLGEWSTPEFVLNSQVAITPTNILNIYSGVNTLGNYLVGLNGGYPGSQYPVTGDKIRLSAAGPLSAPPGGLGFGGTNYVSGGKVYPTYQDSILGTNSASIIGQGSGNMLLEFEVTERNRDALLMDIPEFATFITQWVKCRCMEKEGDPRLAAAAQILVQQKQQMVETLSQAIPDDNDEIQADFSAYNEMS